MMWECPLGDKDDERVVEHGIFPSTTEATMSNAITMACTFGGDEDEKVEHGSFPSTLEACGVEETEPTLMCLSDEKVPIPCEFESHLAHLSESESELSDSTICEFECFHFEGLSDTPLEREVVDRSCEAILLSNNLTSTSRVFSHCVLGSLDDVTPPLDKMVPNMDTMYMEHDDDATTCLHNDEHVGHMDSTIPSTPTSNERDYKGMGVDVTMIPLVDMMTYDCSHAMDDLLAPSYESFLFPCDTLFETNVDHVELPICDDFSIDMPSYECFQFFPVVNSNMTNNCSFPMFVDNNDHAFRMLCNKCLQFSPIDACNMLNNFSFTCVVCNNDNILDNEMAPIAFSHFGDVWFSFRDLVPSFTLLSNHPHMSYVSIDFDVFGDEQMKSHVMMDDVFVYHAHNFFLWVLVCIELHDRMSTSMDHELTTRALESIHLSCASNPTLKSFSCFASNKLNNCSYLWFVCNHDVAFGFPNDKRVSLIFHMDDLWVATNMMNNGSFKWLVGNHNDIWCMSCHEYNGFSQFGVATNMLKTCSFMCFVCHHDDILDILHCVLFMEFLCSHILKMFQWIVYTLTLHLHYVVILLCCANGAMTKNGHVIIDMLLFLAHTWVAWSLMFIGMVNSNSSTRSKHLPPCHGDEQESRTTLFKGGEMM
jgi:hypothetical protein